MSGLSLSDELLLRLDPTHIATMSGFDPDPWQSFLVSSPAPRKLLLCSRQVGKSTATAMPVIRTALTEPGSLSIITAPTESQAGELFAKAMGFYRDLGAPVPLESDSAHRCKFVTGSRIVALPGSEKSIRGYSGARLLVLDEASRVEDDLYRAVRPMLAVSGGTLIALTTPFGKRGWFYDAWIANRAARSSYDRWLLDKPEDRRDLIIPASSGEDWERICVPAHCCPRISPEFLAEERANLGEFWFRQEYQCEFLDAATSVFRPEEIEAAFERGEEAWW